MSPIPMKQKTVHGTYAVAAFLLAIMACSWQETYAHDPTPLVSCEKTSTFGVPEKGSPRKMPSIKSVTGSIPYGYERIGDTQLYARKSGTLDFYGLWGSYYYSSTFSDHGYTHILAIDNVATEISEFTGETYYLEYLDETTGEISTVLFIPKVEQQGELARVCLTVMNTGATGHTISFGTYADVMIGQNDRAPISRRLDTLGNTYGLTMKDGNGAQLCVLFGQGLKGVNAVDDFWFGYYYQQNSADAIIGNYSPGNNWLEENGSYDSGMGWCWKNRYVGPGETLELSYLIGVGDVNLEPSSTFDVTPDDPDGWNDLTLPHRLTINGTYESPAGLRGSIEYAVEQGDQWLPLTGLLESGTDFSSEITVMFDSALPQHTIHFRTIDEVGNTAVLTPIVYEDVRFHAVTGIRDLTYTGQPLEQTGLLVDGLGDDQYTVGHYTANINAGTASFRINGVFPHTIGSSLHTFTVIPQPLAGGIILDENRFTFDNTPKRPAITFDNPDYRTLAERRDYNVAYSGNTYPGTATVTVSGTGNYTGSLTADFFIDKGDAQTAAFDIIFPDSDILHDDQPHGATLHTGLAGLGEARFTYTCLDNGTVSAEAPSAEGNYAVNLTIEEGEWYYRHDFGEVYRFAIYKLDMDDWNTLVLLDNEIRACGRDTGWNLSGGPSLARTLSGTTFREGKLKSLRIPHQEGTDGSHTMPFPAAALRFRHLETLDLSNSGLAGDPMEIINGAENSGTAPALATIVSLDLSHNSLEGNIGAVARKFTALSTLKANDNRFKDLFPEFDPHMTDIDISCQQLEMTADLNISETAPAEIATLLPSIMLYDSRGQRTDTPGFIITDADYGTLTAYGAEWGISLEVSGNAATISTTPYCAGAVYHAQSGDMVNVFRNNGYADGTSFRISLGFNPGDADFIGGTDASDLQATILHAFGAYGHRPFNFTAADTYTDGTINVQDVVATVNILLASAPAPKAEMSAGHRAPQSADAAATPDVSLWIEDGRLMVETASEIAALTIDASDAVSYTLSDFGLSMSTRNNRMAAYSLDGAAIPCGRHAIGACLPGTSIVGASMSDPEANHLTVSLSAPDTSSVVTVGDNSAASILANPGCEIYSPSGQRLATPQPGINILRAGDRTAKIIVRATSN